MIGSEWFCGKRLIAVGIDLDDLEFYRGIHALPQVPDSPIMYQVALPRFLEICERLSIKATLFAIGRDMAWPEARGVLKEAVGAGHEVGNHSLTHRYDLSRLEYKKIEDELKEARERLQDAIGAKVVGFRSPGYNLTQRLVEAIVNTGHRYDSSLLPSPSYFLARAAIITSLRLRGRRSASIVGRPLDFVRGHRPFIWRKTGLQEFPITACGPLRLPLIGTFIRPWGLARSLIKAAARLDYINLEFHGIDFLDIEMDRLDPALAVEPVLRVPLKERIKAFEEALGCLKKERENILLMDSALQSC